MAKDNYSSRAYNFLVKSGYIDPQEVNFNSFNAQMSNPEFSRSVYSNFENAKKNGKIGKLKPYEEFVAEFGVTSTPTTETEVVAEEVQTGGRSFPHPDNILYTDSNTKGTYINQPDGTYKRFDTPTTGGIGTPSNQPTPTATETQIAPINQQAGQVQGGTPGVDPLNNTPQQQFQWSGQQVQGGQPQVQAQMPQTPEQGAIQQESVNPADLALSTLGSAETSLISQIGSELKGIAETGYSLDNKIVSALEGTPFEGGYKAPYSKPEDSWIYQAGQGLQNFTEENLYRNPEYAGGVADIVGQGLGSVGAIALTGGLSPAGGIMKLGTKAMTNPQLVAYGASQLFKAPMIRGAFAMVGQETDSARQLHRMANQMDKDAYVVERMALGEDKADAGKAWETLRTKTEDEVAESMILPGVFAGITEAIPLERLLVRLGKPAQNIVLNAFKQGGITGVENATQELIQQGIINAGIGNTYNEAHRLTTGLLESAEGGGATGFVLGSVLTALVGKRANVKQRVQAGEITSQEAIAEMEDINKAEKLVQDKLQALDNRLLLTEGGSKVAGLLTDGKPADKKPIPMGGGNLPSSGKTIITPSPYEVANLPEAETFFESNEPALTNPLVTMPTEIESVFDKIADGIMVSPESLHTAYQWVNDNFKGIMQNKALSDAEKGATLNIFNGMLSDIDKANTEGQKFVEEVEIGSVQDRVPAVRPEGKLPEGQKPAESVTPALDQAKQIREENKKKQAGTNVLPSSGQPIVTPAPATETVTTTTETEVVPEGVNGSLKEDNPALKDETPILLTPKTLSTEGLPDLEIVASKEASQALESEIGGDKGVIDENTRTIPIQEYDVDSNKRSKQIAEQIEENGWIEPLIVSYDKNGNVYIVEGQHRAAALRDLGYDKAPVIVIHEKNLGQPTPATTEQVTETITQTTSPTPTAETVATTTETGGQVTDETTEVKVEVKDKVQSIASEYGWTATPTEKGGYEFSNRNGKKVAIMKVEKGRNVFYDSEGKNKIGSDGNLERGVDDLIGNYFFGKKETPKETDITATENQTPTTETPTLTPVNATDVETITKIENATDKGRELALNKPTNKGLKRAFEAFEDLSARARKAGIYDGKTLKIGGQEVTLDTPAKFKAFLANQGNFDALSEAVKDVKADVKEQPIPEPTPKQVEANANKRMDDAKSSFVFPIGLNPKFKFDVRLPKKVVNFFKEYFRPQGLFTKELFGAKRRNEARIGSQTERTKFKVRDLYKAIKKAYPKGVTTADVEKMNEYLQGYAVELPPALYKPLEAMREHIDELSRLMIKEGIIDEKLIPVFDANMGIYTTRTYAIHNDPDKWNNYIANTPEGQQLRNNAVNWLREQYEAKATRIDGIADKAEAQGTNLMRRAELSETSDPEQARKYEDRAEALFIKAENLRAKSEALREQDFDAKIDAFLHEESMPLGVVRKGNVGAKDLGILKKRSDIDEVMRKLMGEEKDPITNYMMSVAKMSALISNNQFLNEAKVQGLKDGTFTTEPKGENIEQIASEGTESMNPLNGLYTTPEIAKAFKEYGEIVNSPWYIDWLLRVNGFIKMNKTLLSQQTHIRNFTSNPIIELANGAFRLGKVKESALSQSEQIFGLPEGERRVKYREYIERLAKLGVLDQGANYRDAMSFYEDMKGGKFDYQKVMEPKLTKAGKLVFSKIKELYKAEDDFWKVYAFENERATLKEAYGDTKTDQELDELAAEKILKTRINYNMSPKIIQAIKRIPFLGTFPTFPAEVIRITANIPQVAVEEMKSGNPVLQKQGAKRMAGFMAAMVGVAGLNKLMNYALGMDDEEEEARKKFLPPWSQNSTLIWRNKNSYIDTGYSDAFNVIKKPLVALARGTDFASGGVDAILQAIDPFVSEEIGYKTIESIKNNRDEYDKPIYDESASPTTKFYQVLSFAMKKSEPGVLTQVKRAYKGETGELAEKGQKYSTFDEIVNATTGQKTTTIDWDNAILFKLKSEVEKIKDSNSFYNKANKQLKKEDTQGRKNQAEITNLAVEQSYNNLVDYYKSAQKIGYKPQQIVEIMKDAGVSTDIIQSIVYDKPYKNYLIILEDGTVLDRDIQRRLRQ